MLVKLKGELISNQNEFKDFLDINTFSKMIDLIIKKKVFGIYNISIGKKVYLDLLNNWLLSSNKSRKNLDYKTKKQKKRVFLFKQFKNKKK